MRAAAQPLSRRSVLQELGEKFHSSPTLVRRMNPHSRFAAGEDIRVPNVLCVESEEAQPARAEPEMITVVVSKKTSALTVVDRDGRIAFYAPVTSGSEHDPLPLWKWVVTLMQRDPVYYYNPDHFWDTDPTDATEKIAPGPNNPVGVVWIGIDKPHYGIHGTPQPALVGHSDSHGCVHLTNWDAGRVASMVKDGTPVVFEE